MTPSYEQWEVSGYMRPVIEWTNDGQMVRTGEQEPVVVVFDPRGWTWHVVIRQGRLVSLTIEGGAVTDSVLDRTPLGYLRDVATTYAEHVESAAAEGIPLSDALDLARRGGGEVRVRREKPSVEDFARQWLATEPSLDVQTGKRTPPRVLLAQHYGVSVHAIDKWTRAARDQGLLPKKQRGRPRTTEKKEKEK